MNFQFIRCFLSQFFPRKPVTPKQTEPEQSLPGPGELPSRLSLTVQEYALLEPFYNAQRPHKDPKSWRELRASGLEPVPYEPMDAKCICDLWNAKYDDNPLKYAAAKK